MNFNNIEELKQNNFEGFISIEKLWENNSIIPKKQGVYLVLNEEKENIEFLETGIGGIYQDKNPNVSINRLTNEFIPNSLVVYIGKANNLRVRIKQYLNFGRKDNILHYGGRFIWQLENSRNLLFCWKILPDNESPKVIESKLILEYRQQFTNRRPFANLQG